jgi:predicted chitinase
MELNLQQLTDITKLNNPTLLSEILSGLNECMAKYEINTPIRVCHFLAQILHESGRFKYFEEIASGKAYEGRADLGNTQPGDGVKFKGRGAIQITGRANYASISKDLGVDFVANPPLLASRKWGIISAGWFWNKRKLNIAADADDFIKVTKRINGGTNGLEDRRKYLNQAKAVLMPASPAQVNS